MIKNILMVFFLLGTVWFVKRRWSEASEEYSNTMVGGGLIPIKSNTTWNEGFEQICLLAYFSVIAFAPNAPNPVKEKDF